MNARGFTLIELVVAITIGAIVLVFATMFIGAPIGAYEAHSRRAVLAADAAGAWPRMESDLNAALPNSLRARRNGSVVVLEMLPVLGLARYKTPPSALSFTTAGPYNGVVPTYLSVNPDANVYSLAGSLAPASNFTAVAGGIPGEQIISVNPAPVFVADSPKSTIFYVSRPVTWLCDESRGTLRRYSNYNPATLQTARDTAAELNAAGAANVLVTQGLTSCNFQVSPASATASQTAAVQLTSTQQGDVIKLMHSSHTEFVP